MSYINIENIRKTYGDVTAVSDVSLEVEDGEFVSILGPSGSGKTTTLELMAGFEQLDSGRIKVDGEDISGLPPEDRNMSMVFQRLALFPHMSVFDNIAYGLRMGRDLSESEIEDRVHETLELVELPGYGQRSIQELSGGEQQRVALARAIIVGPDLLLFDEPLSDLDKMLRENMRHEIAEIHNNLDITSIYVTHNQREALSLSDRIAIMREGEVVQFDTPETVYNEPNNEFVANFVGKSNFIDGELEAVNGESWFVNRSVRLPLDGASLELRSTDGNREATIYVRPEDIELDNGDLTNGHVQGTVQTVTHLGSTTEYAVDIEGTSLLVTALGPPRFSADDRVGVTFAAYNLIGVADE
jgi:ABC-type Fe3+/spermidine/putrescine transport system ATPase subunit